MMQESTPSTSRARLLPRDTLLPLLARSPRKFVVGRRGELVALVIAAGLDLFTTLWNIRLYGPSIEVHPVQKFVVETLGTEAGVPLAKLTQLAFVIFVTAWWRPWCRWILNVCAALYTLAAANNWWLWL